MSLCVILRKTFYTGLRSAHQTGDKPESDVITEEKGLLHCHRWGVKPS